jgi:hypothetical protein
MNPKRHEEINLLQTEKIKGINLARFVPKVLDAALSACLAAAYKYKRLHPERGKKRDRDRGGKTGPEAIVPEKKRRKRRRDTRTRSHRGLEAATLGKKPRTQIGAQGATPTEPQGETMEAKLSFSNGENYN